jgi:hypothetical protein
VEQRGQGRVDTLAARSQSSKVQETSAALRQKESRTSFCKPWPIFSLKIYYHSTNANAAEAILQEGFVDNNGLVGAYHAGIEGVLLSDVPLDCNEGAKGDQLLEIALPESVDISEFELIEEEKPYREWCVPAEIINREGKIRPLDSDETDQAWQRRFDSFRRWLE